LPVTKMSRHRMARNARQVAVAPARGATTGTAAGATGATSTAAGATGAASTGAGSIATPGLGTSVAVTVDPVGSDRDRHSLTDSYGCRPHAGREQRIRLDR